MSRVISKNLKKVWTYSKVKRSLYGQTAKRLDIEITRWTNRQAFRRIA